MASAAPRAQTIMLLDYDPDLGRGMDPARRAEARQAAVVTALRLARGRWNIAALAERSPYGLLLLDGLVSREVQLADTTSTQLLGRGDLLQPRVDEGDRLVDVNVAWHVLEPATVALLDERFLHSVRRWPEIVAGLFERLAMQTSRLGTQRALCQLPRVEDRVHALMWFLAERWGRVTPQGVTVPLRLTHELIGRLVGAKRPTVSLAVKLLDEQGAVHRRADGAWLLGEPFASPAAAAPAARRAGSFVGPEQLPPEPSEPPLAVGGDEPGLAPAADAALPLFERIERMRGIHRLARAESLAVLSRAAATRTRSVALRARLGRERG